MPYALPGTGPRPPIVSIGGAAPSGFAPHPVDYVSVGSGPPHNPLGTAVTPTVGTPPPLPAKSGCATCDRVTAFLFDYWWAVVALVVILALVFFVGR